ncbi:hypothetical protein WJX75_004306 [Coccomyxa subellipsoidea]|uniref:Histone H2B n=1 Tax=Coccomyxa subellipsoidea TaxID=248742 RepID=A0ABR2YGC9_9CHLO
MAPKAEKKPAKKVAKTAKTGGKKKSKAKVESFKIYIYKVLKQVHPDTDATIPFNWTYRIAIGLFTPSPASADTFRGGL